MIQGLYEIKTNESEKLFTMWLDAFHDYPKLAEAFPQMDKKLAAMEATIRFYGMYDLKYGHAYATDENIDDGIVIVDSEDMEYTPSRYIEAGCYSDGYKAAMNRLTEEEKNRRIAVFDELDELEKTMDIPYPHIYIDFLGVRRSCQGQGRGRKLIHKITEYADGRNRPLMLFTNTSDDVAFYQKERFKVIGVAKSDKYGFENTYMVREPGK